MDNQIVIIKNKRNGAIFAVCETPQDGVMKCGFAFCNPKDMHKTKKGRAEFEAHGVKIATGRLKKRTVFLTAPDDWDGRLATTRRWIEDWLLFRANVRLDLLVYVGLVGDFCAPQQFGLKEYGSSWKAGEFQAWMQVMVRDLLKGRKIMAARDARAKLPTREEMENVSGQV